MSAVRALSLFIFGAACGVASPTVEPTITLPPGSAVLKARVSTVKVGKGPVFCDLFNASEGFPGPSPIIGGGQRVDATSPSVECTYTGLPAGTYALSVVQDENDNGTLDTSAFGAPVEGYGASNNVLPATSAPRFSESTFELDDGAERTLDVVMRN